MNDEEREDFTNSAKLLSAEELRGMLGGEEEEDAIIQTILDGPKAPVEVKGKGGEQDDDAPDDDPDNPDDDQDDDEPDPVDPPAADDKAAPVADPVDPPPADTPPAAPVDEVLPPLDLSGLDAKYKDSIKALDADKAAKLKQMMDGELTPEEYSAYESKYMADRDALRDDKTTEAAWFTSVHQFRAEALKTSGINYATDAAKGEAWDGWVKQLASRPENANKSETWFLEEAHKKVMIEFGITPPAAAGKADKPAAAQPDKPAPRARTPDLSNVPRGVGGLPSAAASDPGDDGEFGHIAKLEGFEYEKAIAGLTPAQRARYEIE
jgi:hypothetical protein